jgi:hypothetical protein
MRDDPEEFLPIEGCANRLSFADTLRQAILVAFDEFRRQHPAETPYAFALIGDPDGNHLGYAVATEQELLQVASEYDRDGYRYRGYDGESFDNREKLTAWLRWANPDDGWTYGDFPERFEVQRLLHQLRESGEFGDRGEGFEELCTEILASIQKLLSGGEPTEPMREGPIVVGFTSGTDPRDFLLTATRANPYPLVRRLWAEAWQAEQISPRIQRIG